MAKALLFDLDGTLLPMNTDEFVEKYMRALAPNIASFLDPKKFVQIVWESTIDMIKNTDHQLTNEQVFIDSFTKKTGIPQSDIWPTFDRFYQEQFPLLKVHTSPSSISKEIVEAAKNQGRKVVIATNPVFPKAAIYERLKWLDLYDFPFDLVTVYEESHFCKPQPKYYLEILEKIGVEPKDAMMIGNDMQEDMVASQIGIPTFLVTDYLIDRGTPAYDIPYRGSLEELKEQLVAKKGHFAL